MRAHVSLLLVLLGACAHRPPPPPANPRKLQLARVDLLEAPVAVEGDKRRLTEDRWCAPDHAFSMPVVPFGDAPTTIVDSGYEADGVTCVVEMFDQHKQLVQVVRTGIKPDQTEDEVLANVAAKLQRTRQVIPEMTTEWVQQNGVTQVQTVNPSVSFIYEQDAAMLSLSQGAAGGKLDCRVDRHFVGAGYYFHIIAVAVQLDPALRKGEPPTPGHPARDPCPFALELAAWTFDNLRVGDTCATPR